LFLVLAVAESTKQKFFSPVKRLHFETRQDRLVRRKQNARNQNEYGFIPDVQAEEGAGTFSSTQNITALRKDSIGFKARVD
jgi:hypothetical protein